MNENLTLSTNGRKLLREFEGLRLRAYQDSVGVWTIGYGHTHGVTRGQAITLAQADAYLDTDVKTYAAGIYQYVHVKLNQNQFDALVSFHFNLGPHILRATWLVDYLNQGKWSAAATQMLRFNRAGGVVLAGLKRRREAEVALFLRPVAPSTPANSKPKPDNTTTAPPNKKPMTYRVKAGDTLSAIAVKYKTSVAQLVKLNGIKNANVIQVGAVLRIK